MADDQAVRQLRERQARLSSLLQHPAWEDLKAIHKASKEKDLRTLAASFMGGTVVDQRKVDERRGFWQGASFVLANPEHAESSLQKALKELEKQRQLEETDG